MAAICSDSNLQALASLKTTPQMQPVHAVDAHWPMVDLGVEVTLAQQRRLTLVETYVLRAFSELPGVTVSEIERNLGLDLQIIKTVMMNLKHCRAIEYGVKSAEVDEDLRRVRQELGTVNDTLLASGLTPEQRKVHVARRDVLKAQEEALVENLEANPVGVDWSQRSATLTPDGKQALKQGIIKEPSDVKMYRFARCLVTGALHQLNSTTLPAHSLHPVHEGAIEPDQVTEIWALEKKHIEEDFTFVGGQPWFPQLQARRVVDPSREEISKLLQQDERVRVNILGHEVRSRSLCDVPTTLCLSVDTSSSFAPLWSLHQERDSTYRFDWMEAHLHQDSKAQSEAMKAIQSTLLPNRRSTPPPLNSMEGVPWVMADSVLSGEASMMNSDFLFDLKKGEIFSMTAMDLPGLDRLEASRVTITINPTLKKNYKLEQNDQGHIQSLTVAKLHEGKQHPVFGCKNWLLKSVRIDVNLNDEVFSLPLLGVDRAAGAKMAQTMDAYLRTSLKSEHMFLLTGAEDDLERWIVDLIQGTGIDGLAKVLDVLRLRAYSSTHDYAALLLAGLVEHRPDLFAKDPVASVHQVMTLLERKQLGVQENGFRYLEGLLHSQLVRSIHSSSSGEDIASLWNDVRAGRKEVAWEDRAQIEYAMDGHCYSTRSMVQTHTEGIIADILEATVGTGRVDLGKMIEALRREGLIDNELFERLHARRKERNAVVHVRDKQTSLETTLEHIRDMRAVLGDRPLPSDDERWKAPSTNRTWNWSMDAGKLDEHLTMIQTVIEAFPKIDLSSHLWLSYLTQHQPLSYSGVPTTSLNRLKFIHETGRLAGIEGFRQSLLESSVKSWRASLPAPDSIMLGKDVLDVLNVLEEMGDLGVRNSVSQGILREIPHPRTLEALLLEARIGTTSCFKQADLNLRMKQSVEGKSFAVSLSDLRDTKEEDLRLLPGGVAESMFKTSLRPFTVKVLGDVDRLTKHVSTWESLAEVSNTHAKVLAGLDPWLMGALDRDLKSIVEALGEEEALNRVKAELRFSTSHFPRCKKAIEEWSTRLEKRLKNASNKKPSSKKSDGDAR